MSTISKDIPGFQFLCTNYNSSVAKAKTSHSWLFVVISGYLRQFVVIKKPSGLCDVEMNCFTMRLNF